MYLCKFCSRECKSTKSYRGHEDRCKQNPNRLDPATWNTSNRKGLPGTNAHIKARQLGLPDPIVSLVARQKMSIATIHRNLNESEQSKIKRRFTIAQKVELGEWHVSLAKQMHIDYNGIDLHGSWELAYARYLDSNNINWIRNKESFLYVFEGRERRYTPEFYLVDTSEYVEIKGYKINKDDAKWEQFPKDKKLIILMRQELIKLKIIPS